MVFSRVYSTFAERGLTDDLTFNGSGKLALPETTDRFSTSKRFIDPSSVSSRLTARTPASSATSGP
ncbi:hypothetical protein [Streptomyces sp. NPDC001933]|uniref:hypothetical protein n=1 Tax=Streptomyces sp. NPDC001933 TaxID=3364626 RepID=UPI0036CE9705